MLKNARMHGRGWEGAAPESDAVDRASVLRLPFFFFLRFVPTRLDSRRCGSIRAESASNRAEPACFGHIGTYWPATDTTDTAETCRNRPKQAEIGLETRRRGRISDLRCVSCLILSLFCESSILMCFLRIF